MIPRPGRYTWEKGSLSDMPELRTQLKLTQTQKLAMTQTLRQQLEILQIPSLELDSLIETELSENPLLEEEGTSSDKTEGSEQEEDTGEDEDNERDDAGEDDPLDDYVGFLATRRGVDDVRQPERQGLCQPNGFPDR